MNSNCISWKIDLDQQIKDCFMLVNTKRIGLVLALKPAFRIWNLDAPKKRKLIVGVLIILTSWIGLLFYDFYGRRRFPVWLNQ